MDSRDVVVIGAGPAGLSAAIEVAKRGIDVLLIDGNSQAGGQLFKQIHKFFGSKEHRAGIRGYNIGNDLLEQAKENDVEIWLNSFVIGLFKEKTIAVERKLVSGEKTVNIINAKKIVIATGASENAVCFEGWTLPGVITAGAAQTMVNINRVLPGRKVLMIGSGNVGLIVSYQLMQGGAEIVALIEATSTVGGYIVHASKIARAGVPIYTQHVVVKARGNQHIEEAVFCQVDDRWNPIKGSEKTVSVDLITIAAGLKPLAGLAMMHGCNFCFIPALGGWIPFHDLNMQTTNDGIYVAGDITGVEEANTALEEGRLAGLAIAESLGGVMQTESTVIKEGIMHRLEGLRSGMHGGKRLLAKNEVISKFVTWQREVSTTNN